MKGKNWIAALVVFAPPLALFGGIAVDHYLARTGQFFLQRTWEPIQVLANTQECWLIIEVERRVTDSGFAGGERILDVDRKQVVILFDRQGSKGRWQRGGEGRPPSDWPTFRPLESILFHSDEELLLYQPTARFSEHESHASTVVDEGSPAGKLFRFVDGGFTPVEPTEAMDLFRAQGVETLPPRVAPRILETVSMRHGWRRLARGGGIENTSRHRRLPRERVEKFYWEGTEFRFETRSSPGSSSAEVELVSDAGDLPFRIPIMIYDPATETLNRESFMSRYADSPAGHPPSAIQ